MKAKLILIGMLACLLLGCDNGDEPTPDNQGKQSYFSVEDKRYLISEAEMSSRNWEDVDDEGNPIQGQYVIMGFDGEGGSLEFAIVFPDAFKEGTYNDRNTFDFEVYINNDDENGTSTGTLEVLKEDGEWVITFLDESNDIELHYKGSLITS